MMIPTPIENENPYNYPRLENYDFFIKNKKKCVVLGNGISINDYTPEEGVFMIGVNDICKKITPNILFIVDEKRRFKEKERVETIENSECIHVIRDGLWNFKKGKTLMFKIGHRKDFDNFNVPGVIDCAWDSPYMAILLAAKLGFKTIEVIGVDYCDNHFYAEDGTHNLMKRFKDVNECYKNLVSFLASKNIKVYNISSVSKVTAIPHYEVRKEL